MWKASRGPIELFRVSGVRPHSACILPYNGLHQFSVWPAQYLVGDSEIESVRSSESILPDVVIHDAAQATQNHPAVRRQHRLWVIGINR